MSGAVPGNPPRGRAFHGRGSLGGEAGGAPAAQSPATAICSLGRDREESARLRQQSAEMRPYSARLLDRTGLAAARARSIWAAAPAASLTCSPSESLCVHVPGVRHPVHVTMARQFAAEHGLGNVEVVEADARHTGLPPDSFDLVHARTLLVNIPEPAEVLAEMTRLARPGGWFASLGDAAPRCAIQHIRPGPPCDFFLTAFSRTGADLLTGRRLPELYRQAGLADVGTECVAPSAPAERLTPHDPARSGARHAPGDRGARHRRRGGTRRLDQALREHLADPGTLVMPFLYFMAWGRKPVGSRKREPTPIVITRRWPSHVQPFRTAGNDLLLDIARTSLNDARRTLKLGKLVSGRWSSHNCDAHRPVSVLAQLSYGWYTE